MKYTGIGTQTGYLVGNPFGHRVRQISILPASWRITAVDFENEQPAIFQEAGIVEILVRDTFKDLHEP